MKIKKPSLKGVKNCGYLGHFAQDQYLEKGHNFSGNPGILEKEKEQEYINAPMAYDFEEKRRRENEAWQAGAKEREQKLRAGRMKSSIERLKTEMMYGKEADFREVMRAGMKRQKRY